MLSSVGGLFSVECFSLSYFQVDYYVHYAIHLSNVVVVVVCFS